VKLVSFDVESHLIRAGCLAPRLVCLSFAIPHLDGVVTGLVLRDRALERRYVVDEEHAIR